MRTVRMCAYCGVQPSRGFSRGKYCQDSCRMADCRRRKKQAQHGPPPESPQVCVICGVNPVVAIRAGNIHRAKYCSDQCKNERDNRSVRAKYSAAYQPVTADADITPEQIDALFERARLAKRTRWQPVAQRQAS